LRNWVRDLNHLYKNEAALHERDCDPAGFEWIDCGDSESSVVSLLRKGQSSAAVILVICNFTPVPRHNYRLGAPRPGFWREILNSDAAHYGGSNMGNIGGVDAVPIPLHGRRNSLTITLPPLSVMFFKNEG
jgi:1,4-alpha-glucan branching enzyme